MTFAKSGVAARKRVLIFGFAVLVALVMSVPAALGGHDGTVVGKNPTASCTAQINSTFAPAIGAGGVFAGFVVAGAKAAGPYGQGVVKPDATTHAHCNFLD
jgi:hypothetical protein